MLHCIDDVSNSYMFLLVSHLLLYIFYKVFFYKIIALQANFNFINTKIKALKLKTYKIINNKIKWSGIGIF